MAHVTSKLSTTKIAVAGVVTLGLAVGVAAPFAASQASADRNKGNSHQWWDRNTSADAALVVEAVEAYLAGPRVLDDGTTPPETPEMTEATRVTKLKIQGEWATGMITYSETDTDPEAQSVMQTRFYAHKENGMWNVIHESENQVPEATIKKFGVPRDLTSKEAVQ